MGTIDKAFILAGVLSLGVLVGISSCDDNESVQEVKPTKTALEATIEKELWKVTYYFDGSAEREEFNGMTFEFLRDGGFVAMGGRKTVNGVWSAFDTPDGHVKFNMEFQREKVFDVLSEDWVVVENTDTKITLEDIRKKNNKLTLEKV